MEGYYTLCEYLDIIVKHLAADGYWGCERVFGSVFRQYAKYARSNRLYGDPCYRSTVALRADPELTEAPLQDITKVIVYPHEPDHQHALREITSEWANRTVIQQEKIRDMYERHNEWREQFPHTRWSSRLFFNPHREMMNLLRGWPIEKGLDILAIITGYWSYLFRPSSYVNHYFHTLGWSILDTYHINDFIARTSVMFIAMGWHVEYIVPIYWELIQKKREEV